VGLASAGPGDHAQRTTQQLETAALLRVEVEDAGRWRPDRPDNPGGRGFNLMRALTDGVHVVTGETGTTVRLTVRLQSQDASGVAAVPALAPATAAIAAASPPTVQLDSAPLVEVHEDRPPLPP
jgi:hypothetical protein